MGFVLGKAKVAPSHGCTIPRLELCAAVLAVEITDFIIANLDLVVDRISYYTDSKVVLGYIHNQSRRFYIYVGNRVERIRRSSNPDQWTHVPTDKNPADLATRSVPASQMQESKWLLGPTFLLDGQEPPQEQFPLADPTDDTEVRPLVKVLATRTTRNVPLGSGRFERFSQWSTLVQALSRLRHIAYSYAGQSQCTGWHLCAGGRTIVSYRDSESFVIKQVQQEVYHKESECIRNSTPLPKDSPLLMLNPVINDNGILRVGGRLSMSELDPETKHPIIIPGHHHIATLLVRHYHEEIKHQGRHFTEGKIRTAGYWITGAKRLIASTIYKCVACRKLRGKHEQQRMADLPPDRLKPSPPFSRVGVDTFGPWSVVTRRTRGGQANNKRWAILFTCLCTRAIHIEVIEEMSSSSFINALRRLIAIRGKVTQFRSDRGTNFVGATADLGVQAIHVEDGPVKDFLFKKGTVWVFNPPHSSHMGGVWERMIGVTRRILESMMRDVSSRNLTHEVLVTFMAEVSAIVNARPIVQITSDPESPFLLTPSTLLTQKTDHTTEFIEYTDLRDMYRAQWRYVQMLSDTFWNRWRQEYLQSLQARRKWQQDRPNVAKGDIVLLKEKALSRNEWPLGIVDNAIPGSDGKVRKAEVRITRDGKSKTFTRPITEMVVLVTPGGPNSL